MLSGHDYLAIRVLLPILIGIAVTLTVVSYNKAKPEIAIWCGYAAYALLGLLGAALLHEKIFSETETSGILRPATESTPANPCSPIPTDAIALLFGKAASYTSKPDQTFLRVGDVDLLSIHRKPGGMTVSGKIYSPDRKIVAQIIDNKFHINPSNYFRRERPDPHTLTVFNQEGDRVLHVRYLNDSAIRILGKFHSLKGTVEITEDEVLLPNGGSLSDICFGNVDVAIMVD